MADDSLDRTTRPSLLLRLREPADREAWQTFVDVYGPLIYGHCRRGGLDRQDAEDVTQEVLARLSQAIQTFEYRPDVGQFRTWLGTVVHNEVCRFLKRKCREVSAGGAPLDQIGTEDNRWTEEFNAQVLQAALERSRPYFEEPTWRAFEMVWLENRSANDVARELVRDIDWVYVAKSRVLKRLWQEVQELADDTILAAFSFR